MSLPSVFYLENIFDEIDSIINISIIYNRQNRIKKRYKWNVPIASRRSTMINFGT